MLADSTNKTERPDPSAEGSSGRASAPSRPGVGEGGSAPASRGQRPAPSQPSIGSSRSGGGAASSRSALEELARNKRGDDLARLVHTIAFAAADERRTALSDGVSEVADRAGLTYDEAETKFGNVLRALERGSTEGAGAATRALLGAALARGIALSPPEGAAAEERVAETLTWLATHTPIDALPCLDDALGARAAGFWLALGGIVRRVDAGKAPHLGRAGALVAAASLVASSAPTA